MNRLNNKIALVTGAAQGLGEAIARGFAKEGATVILTDINLAELKNLEEELHKTGAEVMALELDVTNEDRWKEVIQKVTEKYGQLDILVNNAGIGTHGNIETTTYESWKKVLNVNLDSVFLGTKYGAQAMIKRGNKGSIINISSIAGIVGDAELLAYSATKGGIRLMTKSAAIHLAKKKTGIRVNSVHPAYMNTELMKLVPNPEDMLAATPMGSFGDPEMIAQGAIYLGSDESAYSTGTELVIDGGYTAI